jgi:hypothetical protein
MRTIRASLLALLSPALALAQDAAGITPITHGSAFLEPVPLPAADWQKVVKLRYRCRVAQNECREHAMWKIVFAFIFFQVADGAGGGYELQCNAYSNRFIYPHLSRRAASGEVAGLQNVAGETGLFLSIPDNLKNRRVGAQTRSPAMFPTLDQEIDGFRDLWKREQVAQTNLTGKTVTVSIIRGQIAEDLSGWTVHGDLPPGAYRIWTITAQWDAQEHRVDFALPARSAEFIASQRPMQIATEAFFAHAGLFKVLFWGIESQSLGTACWLPMRKWKLAQTDAAPSANTWGFKSSEAAGEPAIEASNDGSPTYLARGESLQLR